MNLRWKRGRIFGSMASMILVSWKFWAKALLVKFFWRNYWMVHNPIMPSNAWKKIWYWKMMILSAPWLRGKFWHWDANILSFVIFSVLSRLPWVFETFLEIIHVKEFLLFSLICFLPWNIWTEEIWCFISNKVENLIWKGPNSTQRKFY